MKGSLDPVNCPIRLVRSLLTIALVIGAATVSAQSDLGVALSYPLSIPGPLSADSLFAGVTSPSYELTLEVDSQGKVSALRADKLLAVAWQKRLNDYLSRFTFRPGKINGRNSVPPLIARISVDITDSLVCLEFPLDTLGRVRDPLLYERNLQLAGVTLPAISKFPWYHAVFKNPDSVRVLPYVLTSIKFDQRGRCTSAKVVGSNYPGFKQQLASASLYGDYRSGKTPAGKAIRKSFLLTTFIPTSHYPTKPWTAKSADSLDLHDRLALRLVPDTVGIMIPPLPVSRTPLIVNFRPKSLERTKELALAVRVGDDGRLRTAVSPATESGLYPLAMAIENQIKFYPALGFDGRTRNFDSVVYIRPEGESSVRISLAWLGPINLK